MSDIVERLRRLYVQNGTNYVQEAADEIERLRADAERYRYLRDKCSGEVDDYGTVGIKFRCDFEHYRDLDASIDAAMGLTRPAEE